MSTIKSSTTLTTAYSVEADTTGALVIQTGATPTTAVTVSSAQVVTLANALPVASGGTGATSNAAAPFALKGANSDITSLTGLTTALSLAQGGTAATSASAARTSLGLAIGTDVLAPNGSGASLTSLNASNISSGTLAAARLPAGTVLQVVQSTQTTTTTYSSAKNWISMSSFLSASITPTSSSNKILILVQIGKVHNINGVIIRLTRGGSVISGAVGDSAGSRPSATTANVSGFNGDANHSDGLNISFLDSPSTTSSTAYSFDAYSEAATATYFNRSIADANNTEEYSARVMSSIILMEIAG